MIPPTQPEKIALEIQKYLALSSRDFGDAVQIASNPFTFWNTHADRFPILARVAKRFVSLPASSAEVERVASTGGRIMTPLRSAMKPKNTSMLIFLAHNHTFLKL